MIYKYSRIDNWGFLVSFMEEDILTVPFVTSLVACDVFREGNSFYAGVSNEQAYGRETEVQIRKGNIF